MSILHVSLLGGMLLVSIPVLIHLFNRVRGQRIRFPAIRLVDESPPPKQRRRRFEDIPLMLLRVMAVILLTLWISRPYRTVTDANVGRGTEPEASVIILDNSASMDFREGGESRFDHAKSLAKSMVSSLKPEDQAVILPLVNRENDPESLSQSRNDLQNQLEKIRLEFAGMDPFARIEKAMALLDKSELEVKAVYFFTDLQAATWEIPPVAGSPAEGVPGLKLIDVRRTADSSNRAIVAAHPVSEASGQSSVAVAEARIANFSESGASEIEFELKSGNQSVLRGAIEASAGTTATARLSYDASSLKSDVPSWVEIEPDRLPADDRRYLVLSPLRKLNLLIVDGDPQALDARSESYYLRQALHPNPAAESRFQFQVVSAGQLPELGPGIDAVFLLNVRELPRESVGRLIQWTKDGGSVFMSVGDLIDPDRYNEEFGELLPLRIRGIRALGDEAVFAQGGDDRRERIERFASGHPVFRPFTALEKGGFGSAKFQAYALGESGGGEAISLMWMGSGAPMLVERKTGKGRTVIWMSSIDRDWSDLVFKPVFLPLMNRLTEYLCGALGDTIPLDVSASRPVELVPPPGAGTATLETPDGRVIPLEIAADGSDRPVRITDTWERGGYTVVWGSGARSGERVRFAVNIDPREADLRPLDTASIEQLSRRFQLAAVGGPSGTEITGASFSLNRREELYRPLILAIVLILLLESGLALAVRRR